MRTHTVTNEKTGEKKKLVIRALTRNEVKSLKDFGYTLVGCMPKLDTLDDAVDKSLAMVLSEDDLKFLGDCGNLDTHATWQELNKETYGDKSEEKNSVITSGGSTPGSGLNTAEDAAGENEKAPATNA